MNDLYDDASLEPVEIKTSDLSQYDSRFRQWQGIPGVCWAGGDRLFATWYSGGKTECSENYVLVVMSNDAGMTWSDQILVIDPPDDNVRAFDSTLWRDPEGRIWLFWTQSGALGSEQTWDGRAGVWYSVCNNPVQAPFTWSHPARICDGVMMNKPWVSSLGHWMLPVAIWNSKPFHPDINDRQRCAGLVVSKDNGKTFKWIGGVRILENVFDEHVIFDKDDGTLMLWARTVDGIAESISSDNGETWCDSYKNGMTCPNSRFSIAKARSGRLLLVNHDNPRMNDFSNWRGRQEWCGRNNLAVMVSDDEGASWASKCLLDERQGVSYPDIDVAMNGRIVIIYDYERFNIGSIIVRVLKEEDILKNRLSDEIVISKLI